MGKPYTTDGTPPTGDVFAGMLETEFDEAELVESSTGKQMAKLHLVTTDSNEEGYRGKRAYLYLVIGTDEDPGADDPLTFTKKATFGFKQLRDIWSATRFPKTQDLESDVPGLKGYKCLTNFTPEVDKETKEVRTRARAFFPIGARPMMTRDVNPETGKMGPVQLVGATPPPAAIANGASAGTPPPPPPQ